MRGSAAKGSGSIVVGRGGSVGRLIIIIIIRSSCLLARRRWTVSPWNPQGGGGSARPEHTIQRSAARKQELRVNPMVYPDSRDYENLISSGLWFCSSNLQIFQSSPSSIPHPLFMPVCQADHFLLIRPALDSPQPRRRADRHA
jgi:hypothetical protein